MVPGTGRQRINRLLKSDTVDTGIDVKGTADSVCVEIHIEVLYGINVNALAASKCAISIVVNLANTLGYCFMIIIGRESRTAMHHER